MPIRELFLVSLNFLAALKAYKASSLTLMIGHCESETNHCDLVSQLTHLTCLSLTSFLWDIGKQNNPRCDAAKRGVPSGAILFAYMNFIEK